MDGELNKTKKQVGFALYPEKSGRPVGSTGAVSKLMNETRQVLLANLTGSLEGLAKDLSKLTPLQRIDAIAKLLPYIVPSLKSVELNGNMTTTNIIVSFEEQKQDIIDIEAEIIE